MRLCSSTLLALVALLLAAAATATSNLHPAPYFELNLDLPAEQRWAGAFDAVLAVHSWNDSFAGVIYPSMETLSVFPNATGPTLAAYLKAYYPVHYAELTGIAAAVAKHGGISFTMGQWALFVFGYELGNIGWIGAPPPSSDRHENDVGHGIRNFYRRSCTGILSLPQDRTQSIIHGRNMDIPPNDARNITLNINVTKGGKMLYQVFDWTWPTTGFATSSRLGGVTMEENSRSGTRHSYAHVMNLMTDPKTIPTSFLQRTVQEQEMDFDAATNFIMNAQLAAPVYEVMSGTNRRGAIFTLNTTRNVVAFLNDSSPETFIVQTNYDRWLPDPTDDARRTAAHDLLRSFGRRKSGTELGVWMALSTWPVHNPTTIYSVLMSPGWLLDGYIRTPMLPAEWNKWSYEWRPGE